MSEDREKALEIAISALLIAAKEQGVHVAALCDGAVAVVARRFEQSACRDIAATTIYRLAHQQSSQG